MARARGGGATGYAVALAFFAAGFLICLLLAIIFYTQVSGARSEAEQAQADLRDVASPNELNSSVVAELRGSDGTVVGQLLQRAQAAQDEVATLQNNIRRLEANIDAAERAQQQAREAQTVAEERAAQLQEQLAQTRQQIEQAVSGVRDRVGTAVGEATAQVEALRGVEQNMRQEMEQLRTTFQQNRLALQTQIDQRDEQIRQLNERLEQMRRQEAQLDAKTDPDGRILTVNENDNTAYINIGRDERVVPGLTFEVFGSGELIKLNEFDDVRGKATVEVVTVNQNSSLVRIVRRDRGTTIGDGDVIANVIYDVNATPKFYVFGNFDIDNTGNATEADQRRVQNMIDRWGGRVVDELTPDVDYVVLGERPAAPAPLPPNETRPDVIARNVEQTRQYETYLNLIGEARTLNVPILNQNRFLALIGYYRR
jgi:colicin import membrane protein